MEKHFNDLFENVKNKINVMKNQIARDENPARRLYAQNRCAEEINQICKEILEAIDAHSRAYLEPLNEIKVFKSQFGEDFTPTIISAHDSFDKHDRWSNHKTGRAVDIRMNDLPIKEKRLVVKILVRTLPKGYKVEWEHQRTVNEKLHFQSNR